MVRCADCGFLALRNGENHQLEEVYEAFRLFPEEFGISHEEMPVCFARAIDMQAAIQQRHTEGGGSRLAQVVNEMREERQCGSFTPWQQGFTPKEHREMQDRQWLLDREEKRGKETRDWQELQEREQRKWQRSQQLRFTLMAGMFGLLAALLPAFVQMLQEIVKAVISLLRQ